MNVLDIILAVILLFGIVRGFKNGFFVEVTSLVGLVLGVYGAIHFSYFAGDFLKDKVDWQEKTIQIVAFAITFVIIVLLISLTGKLLTKIADIAALGILNKIAGAAFGVAKLALILSIILIVFSKLNRTLPFISQEGLERSILYNPVKNLAPTLFPSILSKDGEQDETNNEEN
jgi:membrane protein required for colicin V production